MVAVAQRQAITTLSRIWIYVASPECKLPKTYSKPKCENINSLARGKFWWNFRGVIFKLNLVIDGQVIFCETIMMLGVAQHWFMARAEHSPNLMGPSCHHSAGHSVGYAPLDVIPVQGLGLSRSLSESSTYKYFIALRPQTDLSPVACLWHFVNYIDWEVFPMSWYLDWECNRRFVDKLSCVWASQGPDMGASHQGSDLPW